MRVPAALLALALTCATAPASAQEVDEPPKSFEFLRRQADLFFQYKKYEDALASLREACATEEGKVSMDCHRDLANAAEATGRVGLAINAWELAAVLGEEEQREAAGELDRLYATYGRLMLYPPEGRSLPTRPLSLTHKGFLIDPKQKQTLAALVDRTAKEGLSDAEVWLPFGAYTLGAHSFEVTAGEASALVLDPSDVPYQTRAISGADAQFVPIGGPREVSVSFAFGAGGVPGGAVGMGPVRLGGQLTVGGHVGPLRLEVRGRLSSLRGRSPTQRDEVARQPPDYELLAVLDLGVDVRLGGSAWLTPHLGLVAGRVGVAVVGCLVTQRATGHQFQGECALAAGGVGGLAGVDLLVMPGGDPRRVGLRIGLFGEALAARFLSAEGDELAGMGVSLTQQQAPGFARVHGGVDVGVALRF